MNKSSITFSRYSMMLAAVVSLLALSPRTASADYSESVKKACKSDFKKYCPSYDTNSKALRRCMESVAAQLSTRCVNALERTGEHRRR